MSGAFRMRWIGSAAAMVVLWRVAATFHPHPAASDPPAVRSAMAMMGLWFLAIGLWTAGRSAGRAGTLFAFYCVTAGMHWGGPVGFGTAWVDTLLLALYVVVTCASASLFLHLALVFPPPFRLTLRLRNTVILYSPAVLGAIGVGVLLPLGGPVGAPESPVSTVLALMLTFGLLLDLAGLAIWIARPLRATREARRRWRPGRILVALLIGALLQAVGLAGLLPEAGWLNLAFAFFPAAVASSLVAGERDAAD